MIFNRDFRNPEDVPSFADYTAAQKRVTRFTEKIKDGHADRLMIALLRTVLSTGAFVAGELRDRPHT
jgi:hypothetical protein